MTKDAAEVMFKRLFGESKGLHSVRKQIQQAFDAARTTPAPSAPKPEPPVVEECSNMNTAESRYTEDHAAHFQSRSTRLATRALNAPTLLAPQSRHGSWTKTYYVGDINQKLTAEELFRAALGKTKDE